MPSAQDLLEAAAPHLARLDALDARTQEGAMQTLLDMAIAHAGPSATSPKAGTSKGGAKETIAAKLLRECVDLAASLRRLDETAPSEPSDALQAAAKTCAALESGMKAFEAHCTTSAGRKALAASGALEAEDGGFVRVGVGDLALQGGASVYIGARAMHSVGLEQQRRELLRLRVLDA